LLLELVLPKVHPQMRSATIGLVYANEGAELKVGTKLMDFTVDLSAAAAHDCPPIASYRIVIRETAWLRRIAVAPGDEVAVGGLIALFSTQQDEALDTAPTRSIRVAIAGIAQPIPWI